MTQVEVPSSCMKGITIVHVGKRNFRVPTASLPAGFASHQDIYVRSDNKSVITEIDEKKSVEDNKEITLKLDVPRTLYGIIIGKGGYYVKQLRYETKTRIYFPFNDPVTIIGTKDGVEMAKKRIENIIESHNNKENEKSFVSNTKIEDEKKDVEKSIIDNEEENIIINLDVPQSLYGVVIGKGGSTVRQIQYDTKTKIVLPLNENHAVIQGTKNGVEMAKKRIEDIIKSENEKSFIMTIEDEKKDVEKSIIDNEEENIIIKLDVPQSLYGVVIGKGGSTVRQIQYDTKTKIVLPLNENHAVIQGTKNGVEMAKKRIEDIIIKSENEKSFITKIEDEKKDVEKSIIDNEEENIIIKLDVPQSLYGVVIGKGGSTVRQIQYDTKTKITLNENHAAIQGTKNGVEMAKKRIENIIKSSTFNLPPTHFISLPLTDSHLQRKVETFKSDVLNLNVQNIDNSILINSSSLHITIGMLNLYIKEDIEGAVKLLKSLSAEISNLIGARTLVSNLTGIAVMENDPVKAHVLYAKVEEQEALKKLGEYLIKKFAEAGYLRKENRPLKLHATLINTRHRDNEYSAPSHDHRYREYRYPFNAVQILNKFSNIEFGPNRIETIHISKIGEYDQHGRHRSEGCIKLP